MPLTESTWDLFLSSLHRNDVPGVRSILAECTPQECETLINENYGIDNGIPSQEVDGIPLHIAAYYHNSAMIETLLNYGADVDIEDDDEKTALHILCENTQNYCSIESKLEIIKMFLDHGAEYSNLFEQIQNDAVEYYTARQFRSFDTYKQFLQTLHTHDVYSEFVNFVLEHDHDSVQEYLSDAFELKSRSLPHLTLSRVKIDREMILKHPENFEDFKQVASQNSEISEIFRTKGLDLEAAIQTEKEKDPEPLLWWSRQTPARHPIATRQSSGSVRYINLVPDPS